MKSCMGRNVQVCCGSSSISLADATGSFLSNRVIDDVCRDKVDDDDDVIRKVDLVECTYY